MIVIVGSVVVFAAAVLGFTGVLTIAGSTGAIVGESLRIRLSHQLGRRASVLLGFLLAHFDARLERVVSCPPRTGEVVDSPGNQPRPMSSSRDRGP